MIWNLLQLFIPVLMDIVCGSMFISIFISKKEKWKFSRSSLFYLLFFAVSAVFHHLLSEYTVLSVIAQVCVYTAFMRVRFQEQFSKICAAIIGYFGILSVCDAGLTVLLHYILSGSLHAGHDALYTALFLAVIKAVEFLLFVQLLKLSYSMTRIVWRYILLSVMFICVALFLVCWKTMQENSQTTTLVLAIGMLLLDVLFYFTLLDMAEKEKESREYQTMYENSSNQLKLFEDMRDSYLLQRVRVHEFKNHIGCIQGLLEEKKIEEAEDYVRKISADIPTKDLVVQTGNIIVDVIVNQKYREARQDKINFIMKLDKIEYLPLQDSDIVILLSNLLDNALEACRKIDNDQEKIIKLTILRKSEEYFLMVSNRTSEKVIIEDQLVSTTKNDKDDHGIGMQNIKTIIQKYNAQGNCTCEGGWFTYSILF